MTKKHTPTDDASELEEILEDQPIDGEEDGKEKSPAVEELEKVEKTQAEEYLEGWKRTQAEFENYKKRQEVQQKELGGYLIEKLLLDIIPVLDNFRQATLHVPEGEKSSPWVIGIQYIEKQLEDVLKANGVSMIEAKEGEVFDPQIHEAIDHQEEEEESGKHVVSKMLQKGFKIGERVIRPAKVTTK